jgi:hypothetical protein
MKKIKGTNALLKDGILLDSISTKPSKIELKTYKYLEGEIFHVNLSVHSTKFDMEDYKKRSKKLRSDITYRIHRDPFEYRMTGLCIKSYIDPYLINTRAVLRNVFSSCAFEYIFPLYSPYIESINIDHFRYRVSMKRRGSYAYLRKKPLPESVILFHFVAGVATNYTSYARKDTHNFS